MLVDLGLEEEDGDGKMDGSAAFVVGQGQAFQEKGFGRLPVFFLKG